LCIGFVVVADWFFWKAPVGWTLGGYGLLLMAAVLLTGEGKANRMGIATVTTAVAVLCLYCFEEPSLLIVLMGILGLATLGLLLREGWGHSALVWFERWARMVMIGWLTPFVDATAWMRASGDSRRRVGAPLRLLRNWLVPCVLALVFLLLFEAANPLLAQWLGDLKRILLEGLRNWLDRLPVAERIFMWVVVATFVWALLRYRSDMLEKSGTKKPVALPPQTSVFSTVSGETSPASAGSASNVQESIPCRGASLPSSSSPLRMEEAILPVPSAGFIVRCLLLFNLLFAVQTAMDLSYLWGGAALPEGLTHAQYAHRGAYPLMAAAVLAAVFVLATFGTPPKESGRATDVARRDSYAAMRPARRLVYLWLAQNLFLVVSAGLRLELYVEAFTLTRWRVAAAVWMLLVFCGLLWIVIRIGLRHSNRWLINVNTLTLLGILYGCCFLPIDGWIARFNVVHCREVRGEGPWLDLAYLEHLGPESLPALVWFVGNFADSPRTPYVRDSIGCMQAQLGKTLSDWRGWTWRRLRGDRLAGPWVRHGTPSPLPPAATDRIAPGS
jgi:hypothetical protein